VFSDGTGQVTRKGFILTTKGTEAEVTMGWEDVGCSHLVQDGNQRNTAVSLRVPWKTENFMTAFQEAPCSVSYVVPSCWHAAFKSGCGQSFGRRISFGISRKGAGRDGIMPLSRFRVGRMPQIGLFVLKKQWVELERFWTEAPCLNLRCTIGEEPRKATLFLTCKRKRKYSAPLLTPQFPLITSGTTRLPYVSKAGRSSCLLPQWLLSKLQSDSEEWCLLGCYAVWLL
jgi:hypothetical protein